MFVLCFAAALVFSWLVKTDAYFDKQTSQIERTLQAKENHAIESNAYFLKDVRENESNYFSIFEEKWKHINSDPNINYFVYYEDSLVYWTTSDIPVPLYSFDENFRNDIVKLKNGWYRVIDFQNQAFKAFAFILIQNDYSIKNKYLVDRFYGDFHVDERAIIKYKVNEEKHIVKNNEGRPLFSIEYLDQNTPTLRFPKTSGVLYLISLALFILALYQLREFPFFNQYPVAHVLVFAGIMVFLRYINIRFLTPVTLYQLEIFNPGYFAYSSWMPSLGDLILHVLLLTSLLILVINRLYRYRLHFVGVWHLYLSIFLLGTSAAVAGWGARFLIAHLIYDSPLSFDLSNWLALDQYSLIGFAIITCILMDFFLILFIHARLLLRSRQASLSECILISIPAFIVVGILQYTYSSQDLFSILLPFFIYVLILRVSFKRQATVQFYSFSLIILLFAAFSTRLLYVENANKEKSRRMSLAFKIADEQDHIAEYLFLEVENKIRQDKIIQQYLFDEQVKHPYYSPELFNRIAQSYFGGYWSKYALEITPFSAEDLRERTDPQLNYYENNIEFNGFPTASKNLFFINNNKGKINYIGKIEVPHPYFGQSKKVVIYIDFLSKIVTQIAGFPELLLDDKITRPADASGYSFAIYRKNNLTIFGGSYNYPIDNSVFFPIKDDVVYTDLNGYNHLFFRGLDGKIVIVSKRLPNWQEVLSPFTYLTIYFFLLGILMFTYQFYVLSDRQHFKMNFKTRIQISVLAIMMISLVMVGLGVNNFVASQFNKKNNNAISEKLNSIMINLKEKIAKRNQPTDLETLTFMLKELSEVYFTDITFFAPNGRLISSSREAVYNEGLISRQIDPKAFHVLFNKKEPSYIHTEFIGEFEYISAYVTFRDNNNKVIGYIGLPYFLRQKELKSELGASLLALINIYSLLIAVSMIATFLITSRLTGPLNILQEKLSQLRVGRTNEPIHYYANDEIGGLVSEYNRMIFELEQSAQLLARSERESAWREMAKQVAHEVKNPLTPMKLNVQYLIRAWEDKRDDFPERLMKFKNAMIAQIEVLSAIASEFSYFAKMPNAVKEDINLVEVMEQCVDFHRNNEKDVVIEFINIIGNHATIGADRDQLLRAFNNIIHNAIQAIDEKEDGKIIVRMHLDENDPYYVISISDNGNGIPEEVQSKIFAPNFTTKNSGMGLGLAMTKMIIENTGGNITFETETGKGTTFFVKLPVE